MLVSIGRVVSGKCPGALCRFRIGPSAVVDVARLRMGGVACWVRRFGNAVVPVESDISFRWPLQPFRAVSRWPKRRVVHHFEHGQHVLPVRPHLGIHRRIVWRLTLSRLASSAYGRPDFPLRWLFSVPVLRSR